MWKSFLRPVSNEELLHQAEMAAHRGDWSHADYLMEKLIARVVKEGGPGGQTQVEKTQSKKGKVRG